MPEGDTIHRSADVLASALVGRRVTRAVAQAQPGMARVPDLDRVRGALVARVWARGKHLLISFDNGLTLRTHLRMSGSWHRYAPDEPWQRPARQASAVIETGESVAVLFNAPVVELLDARELARSRPLATLGPDLLSDYFDVGEAMARLAVRGEMSVGEALLDQRALAGIGNVYRSEVPFMEGVHPARRVADVDPETLERLLHTARRLLLANSRGGARVTTGSTRGAPGEGLWVYGRSGRPCRRCGTPIVSGRLGELARSVYWCPHCQPLAGVSPPRG